MLRASNPWIATSHLKGDVQLRLFCFPYAGGGASIFRTWSASLPGGIEVCPVQLPGRENRFPESAIADLSQLVTEMEAGLLPYLNVPFAFFGHSMGALLSFELARRLRRHHRILPQSLLVSSHRAPQLVRRGEFIHQLPDEAFLEHLDRLNGTPKEVLQDHECMSLLLPTLRTDFELCGSYMYLPEKPLSCPIAVFSGSDDPQVDIEELKAWSEQSLQPIVLHILPGDHFYLQEESVRLKHLVLQELARYMR